MKLPAFIRRGLAAGRLFWKRHGAKVVLGAGTTAVVVGEGFAVKAGAKLEEVLEPRELEKERIEREHDAGLMEEKEYRKEIRDVKVGTAKDMTKLFAPSIILTGSGLGLIFTSHGMMAKSLAVTAAAGAAIQQSFDQYRSRVREKLGDEEEKNLYDGVSTVEKLEEIQDKDGKKKTVKRTYQVHGRSVSPYAVVFCERRSENGKTVGSHKYKGIFDYDILTLKHAQSELNDKLVIEGHVFWNDMLAALGLPPRKIGQRAGCRISKNGKTDNFIDFGIFDAKGHPKPWVKKMYDETGEIVVDFNLDGDILEFIDMEDIIT